MPNIPDWAIGVVSILGGVGVLALLIEVGDAVRRRLLGPGHAPELRGPHTVIGMHVGTGQPDQALQPEALEDLQRRVAELEERLDFAERLLARQREAERALPPKV
jgi:L-ascorbate metabolism protein UlaG (beta-lactamase superfamily)